MKNILLLTFFFHSLFIYAQQPDALFIDPSGKIGIGTNSPQYTFEVNGETKIDSTLFLNGKLEAKNVSATTLNINSTTPRINALKINQGSFSMGGAPTSPTFAIDAFGVPGGRFLVDEKGKVTIGGRATINGGLFVEKGLKVDTLNVSTNMFVQGASFVANAQVLGNIKSSNSTQLRLQSADYSYSFYASGKAPNYPGLSPNCLEFWGYRGVDANRMLVMTPSVFPFPTIFDGGGNLWIPGVVMNGYTAHGITPEDIIRAYAGEISSVESKELQATLMQKMELAPSQESLNTQKIEALTKMMEQLNSENESLKKRIEVLEAQ